MPSTSDWWKNPLRWPITMKVALVVGLIAISVVCGTAYYAVNYAHKERLASACRSTAQFARIAAKTAAIRLGEADTVLHYLKRTIEDNGEMPLTQQIIGQHKTVCYVYRFDAAGNSMHNLVSDPSRYLPVIYSRRTTKESRLADKIYIGKTVWDKGLSCHVLPVSLPLMNHNGEYDGSIVALVNVAFLGDEFDRIGAPKGSKFVLIGSDLFARAANYEAADVLFSEGMTVEENVFAWFLYGDACPAFPQISKEGEEIIASACRIDDQPLAVRLEIPRQQLMTREADWTTSAIYVAVLISAAIGLATVSSLRGLWLRHVATETLRENQAILQQKVDERTAALRDTNDRLKHLAYYDEETNLPNRAALMEYLADDIDVAKTVGRCGSVIAVNLDNIRVIVDVFGRAACAEVVKESAERLQSFTPSDSFLAHFGSDEFYIVCPGIEHRDELAARLDDLCVAMRHETPCGDLAISVTASLGGAIYPDDGETALAVVQCADSAMYFAKRHGKNTSRVFSQKMHDTLYDDVALTHEMKNALANDEFRLFFQPQINSHTFDLEGYEALIRWPNPRRGLVPPSRFIPLAEKNGLIQPIGKWVFGEACRFIKRLEENGYPSITVSINVSARQFARPDFLDSVSGIVEEQQVNLSQVEIEVTETMLLQSLEAAIAKLDAIRQRGIKVALDDFGTGYSSLNYLLRLPFDTLKIDKSFVDNLPQDEKECELVKAIIIISRVLSKRTVAEGVERADQLGFLKSLGCDVIQGYYFSKALDAEAALEFLRKNRAAR